MATLKGKWKLNENIVLPAETTYVICVFNWGDIDYLSDPEATNTMASGIEFRKDGLYANNKLIVHQNSYWQVDYPTWSVIDFGETERIEGSFS